MDFNGTKLKVLWWAGLLLYCLTGFLNIGIIATDDYEFGIARIVPAQEVSVPELIASSGIRSPIQNLYLLGFTKTAWLLGVNDPAFQLRFALSAAGAINYALLTSVAWRMGGPILLFLVAFYFACPLLYTRPLIESLSTPYVFLSLLFAQSYWHRARTRDIALAIFVLAVGAMFRHQVGICALALALIVLLKRDWKGALAFFGAGVLGFFVTGALDWVTKGELHASMIGYAKYQSSSISQFGRQPFYVFIGLFALLSFPPTLFQRYRGFDWRSTYRPLIPAILYFGIFVLSHSLIVHKEERFMIPILPVFFFLLVPLVQFTLDDESRRWRITYFMILNSLLLPLTSFNVPQNSLIGTAQYLAKHPEIRKVREIDGVLFNFPSKLIGREVPIESWPIRKLTDRVELPCDQVFAIREDVRSKIPDLDVTYERIAVAQPGILEWIVIRLNPSKNARRSPIELYRDRRCGHA